MPGKICGDECQLTSVVVRRISRDQNPDNNETGASTRRRQPSTEVLSLPRE